MRTEYMTMHDINKWIEKYSRDNRVDRTVNVEYEYSSNGRYNAELNTIIFYNLYTKNGEFKGFVNFHEDFFGITIYNNDTNVSRHYRIKA